MSESVDTLVKAPRPANLAAAPLIYPTVPSAGVPAPILNEPSSKQLYPQAPEGRSNKLVERVTDKPAAEKPAPRKGGVWKWIIVFVAVSGVGAGGFLLYDRLIASNDRPAHTRDSDAAAGDSDAGPPVAVAADAGVPATASDAAPGDTPDAGTTNPVAPAGPIVDRVTIRSRPRRARVYIDGSRQGKTPVTLDATTDSHRLAVILPGYKPHIADIAGNRELETIELEPVSGPEGPAGIKVRCRKKNRYYVYIDGVPTGELCPTERLGVEIGQHTVEIYDPINDSRKEFPVNVDQTRRSVRVRVD